MSKFDLSEDRDSRDLFAEAFAEPLRLSIKGVDPAGIDALYLGNYSWPSGTPETMQDP